MLNDVIGGGQVFLHKVRMLSQVVYRALHLSCFAGIIFALWFNFAEFKKLDIDAIFSYKKAQVTIVIDDIVASFKTKKNSSKSSIINAKTASHVFNDIEASKILKMHVFKKSNENFNNLLFSIFNTFALVSFVLCTIVFLLWRKFGNNLREERSKDGKDGAGKLHDARSVKNILRSLGKASDFQIGAMPLVKDSETMHLLATGSTGSGKTNFMHNLLPQIEKKKQPAIVIDQTGEMISKYYNSDRGDIIFNPFDNRSHAWDFWFDCERQDELDRFSNILFSFNRKKHGHSSDPFWEKSAAIVFSSCCEYLTRTHNKSLDELSRLTNRESLEYLTKKLKGTTAQRFLAINNSITASSILAVLSTSTKPLTYLKDDARPGKFSLKEYFNQVKDGSPSWLFLATKPSNRELTLPIISCLVDLALTMLMEIGIDKERRLWFVIDELAALGKLPALNSLMSEGRKYGACVLAGLQSLNQIYAHYGQHDGSTIFGQFGSKFFFRTDEPSIGQMISSICGTETITKQQKNTSFGANTHRDGQSYTEQEKSRNLVEYSDLTKLAVGECYALLPMPEVRLSKIQTPEKNLPNKNPGFESRENDIEIKQLEQSIQKVDIEEDLRTGGDMISFIAEDQKVTSQQEKKRRIKAKSIQEPVF